MLIHFTCRLNSIAKSPIENRSRPATLPAGCAWPSRPPRGSPPLCCVFAQYRLQHHLRRALLDAYGEAVPPRQRDRRQSIFSVIYTSTQRLNRTIRSPYRRRTPPNHTQVVSGRSCAQNETTNLLLLLLLFLLGRGGGATSTAAAGSSSSSTTTSTRRDLVKQRSVSDQNAPTLIKRTEPSFCEPSAINCTMQIISISTGR